MWPSPTVNTVSGLQRHFGVSEEVWQSFVAVAGNPSDDIRPLACLPVAIFKECVTSASIGEDSQRLSVMQASQLGMMYRAAHRAVHLQSGAPISTWVDVDPWEVQSEEYTLASSRTTTPTSLASGERKLKFGQILDQQDDGEFYCHPEDFKNKCYGKYVEKMGGLPQDSEDPTLEQLSALARRTRTLKMAPFVDFGVWVPFQKRVWKSNKYTTFVLTEDGTFVSKLVPGPSCHAHWVASYKVTRTAFVMLDLVTLNNLVMWESHIERLVQRYPTCWHLIVEAEHKARSEHLSRTLTKIRLKMDQGQPPPLGFTMEDPWDIVWRMVLEDAEYWQEQEHIPALSWLARGSRGALRTPAEDMAASALSGGASRLRGDTEKADPLGEERPSPNKNKARREAKRKRLQAERDELQRLRQKGSGKAGEKGAGNPKSSGEEECYAWNNDNGACKGLAPGEPCRGSKTRLHRCTICKSPGHPSHSCPSKKKS